MKKIVNGCLIGSLIACLGCVNAEENKSIADDYIDLIKNYKQSNPDCKIGDFMKYVGVNQINIDKKLAAKLFTSI